MRSNHAQRTTLRSRIAPACLLRGVEAAAGRGHMPPSHLGRGSTSSRRSPAGSPPAKLASSTAGPLQYDKFLVVFSNIQGQRTAAAMSVPRARRAPLLVDNTEARPQASWSPSRGSRPQGLGCGELPDQAGGSRRRSSSQATRPDLAMMVEKGYSPLYVARARPRRLAKDGQPLVKYLPLGLSRPPRSTTAASRPQLSGQAPRGQRRHTTAAKRRLRRLTHAPAIIFFYRPPLWPSPDPRREDVAALFDE
jgi:hypothetical protein